VGQSAHPHAVSGPGGGDRDPCRRARAPGGDRAAHVLALSPDRAPVPAFRPLVCLLQRRQATQSAVAQGTPDTRPGTAATARRSPRPASRSASGQWGVDCHDVISDPPGILQVTVGLLAEVSPTLAAWAVFSFPPARPYRRCSVSHCLSRPLGAGNPRRLHGGRQLWAGRRFNRRWGGSARVGGFGLGRGASGVA
jgi:hypothetical protein